MFESRKRETERKIAELVLEVALEAGKVTFALEAATKLNRKLSSVEETRLLHSIHVRPDEGVVNDLHDALSHLSVGISVADTFTERMIKLSPDLLINVPWGKISLPLWIKLVEQLFERNAGPFYLWAALQPREDLSAEQLNVYGERMMQNAIKHGNAWGLYQGAALANKKVAPSEKRNLLASLMDRKTKTIGEKNSLVELVFGEADRIVRAG